MLQRTVEWKRVKLTIREKINQDLFDIVSVLSKLAPETVEYRFRRDQFSLAVLQTVNTEGLSFEWATIAASPEKMQACYEAWCQMKPALGKVWADTIYELNNTADDEELAPVLTAGES